MMVLYLKSVGYMAYVSRDHLHDLGKFLFGIMCFGPICGLTSSC